MVSKTWVKELIKVQIFLLVLLSFSGCSPKVSPKHDTPPIPKAFVHYSEEMRLESPPEKWWRLFGIEELEALVSEVLEKNHDLRKARFRIEELAERLRVSRAERFPQAEITFSGQRTRTTFTGTTGASSAFIYGEFRGYFRLAYELDLWKKLSSAEKAAYFELLAAEENRKALAQSLVGETVSQYFETAFLQCEARLLSREIELARKRLSLLRKRFASGIVSVDKILSAERDLARLKGLLLDRERRLSEAVQILEMLSGRYPSGSLVLKKHAEVCHLDLSPPPVGLPGELLRRRPDIRAAEAQLKAAAEQVKVAWANRFPRIVLTAEEGRVSNTLKNLLSHRNRLWSLALGATQPLFTAGKTKALEEAARKALRQAEEHYAQTVIQAFREVEFGLLSEKALRKILAEKQKEWQTLKTECAFEEKRFQEGLRSSDELLSCKIRVLEAEREVIGVRKKFFLNRVFLLKALGGGFGSEKEAP